MKVLLIASNIAHTPYYVYPLGLSVVAGALRTAGHEVAQFDFLQNDKSFDELLRTVDAEKPGVIGISIRNIDNVNLLNEQRYIDIVKDIVTCLREKTNVPIVLGGSGFSIMPEAILETVGADYGIVGEGENSFREFVSNAEKGIFPENKCIRSDTRLDGAEIASAFYDPHLIDFYLKRGNVASLQTKRGCPHKCVYCSYPSLEGKHIRCRDPKKVVDDIENLINEHKAKYIFFTDSVFNDDAGHYLKVLKEMDSRGVRPAWTAFFKPNGLDDEAVALMKQTGLMAAEIGSDASSDATLKKLGKSFTFKDIVDCNDMFTRHNVAKAHYYMFGCPGETKETVLEGIENIKNLKKTVSFIFMGIRILPDTILEDIAIEEGIISKGQDLLDPVYYIAPGIDKDWMEETLTEAFKGVRHCVFPPDALDSSLQFLYKLGYSGVLWDMLITDKKRNRKKRTNGTKQ